MSATAHSGFHLSAALGLLTLLALGGCGLDKSEAAPFTAYEEGEEYSGGMAGTTFDTSVNAFGNMAAASSGNQQGEFVTGNSFFRANWVIAPSSTPSRDGLGPMLNAVSCGGCHGLDGRGQPPRTETERLSSLLIRLSRPGTDAHGGPRPDPAYGLQLSGQANPGVLAEGDMRISYTEVPGHYPDGTAYSLRQPAYEWRGLGYGPMPADILFSPRVAQQLPGLGLLEAVEEATLLTHADPQDRDGDGISGRANYVWDKAANRPALGRFGWKANQPTIRQQVADAFVGDMGLTSNLNPEEDLSEVQRDRFQYQLLPNGGSPELSNYQLDVVTFYCASLAVPARRDVREAAVLRGKVMFAQLGCGKCHLPQLATGRGGSIPEFAGQTIRPYTDLLLHDMGPGLADGRPDYLANGQEWRTPPLWGLGLIQTVNRHTTLLHDGRARNAEEAILWHGGEAEQAQQDFTHLSGEDRMQLLRFLGSL